jgi:cytidyltransferase-like protein
MTTTVENGVVLGRFQPLHTGHVEYLSAAKSECSRLFVGITNPDPRSRAGNSADDARNLVSNNPFTYIERHLMIEAALRGMGWPADDFCITPAPVLNAEDIIHYLPPPDTTRVFLTVYDDWGEQKAEIMRMVGYKVDVLWRRDHGQRVTSGTAIRAAIRAHQRWRHLVPKEVADQVTNLLGRVNGNGAQA